MKIRHFAILILVLLLGYSCKKDKQNAQGTITVYNNFLDFGNSTKIKEGGYYALVSDYIYTDRRSVVKIGKLGDKEWQKELTKTGDFDADSAKYNYIGVKEIPWGGCLVFAEVTATNGKKYVAFKKIYSDGQDFPWHLFPMPVNVGDKSKLDGTTIDSVAFKDLAINYDNSLVIMGYMRHNSNHSVLLMKYYMDANGLIDTIAGMQPHEYYIGKYTTPTGPATMKMIATGDRGYVVIASPNGLDQKGFILKTDEWLNEKWRSYNPTQQDVTDLSNLMETPDGNLLIVGKAGEFGNGSQEDYYLLSLTGSFGNYMWDKRYPDTSKIANIPRSITRLNNGDYMITGDQSNYNPDGNVQTHVPGTFIYLQEVSPTGDAGRVYEYKSSFGLHANDVEQLDDAGFLIIGSKHSYGNSEFRDMIIMATLPNGNFNQ